MKFLHARAFALGTICGLVLAIVPNEFLSYFRLVYPTPDTQSAFIKNYNPRQLIERFACGNIVPEMFGPSSGGSAGVGFASHESISTAYIEIDEQHWLPLMRALAADVDNQLLLGGSDRTGGDKNITSRFSYQDGRTLGTVTIPPLVPYDWVTNNLDRHPGCTPVLVSVYIDEVFIPKLPLDATDQLSRHTNRWDRNRHKQQVQPEFQREIDVQFEHSGKQ